MPVNNNRVIESVRSTLAHIVAAEQLIRQPALHQLHRLPIVRAVPPSWWGKITRTCGWIPDNRRRNLRNAINGFVTQSRRVTPRDGALSFLHSHAQRERRGGGVDAELWGQLRSSRTMAMAAGSYAYRMNNIVKKWIGFQADQRWNNDQRRHRNSAWENEAGVPNALKAKSARKNFVYAKRR